MSDNKKEKNSLWVSKKIAAFVLIMLFVPLGVAYSLRNMAQPIISLPTNFSQTAPTIANDTASYVYQLNAPEPGQRVVCIVFDDGWQTQYTNALPILNYYGYKASFAIITSYVGTSWGAGAGLSYMTWNEIINLANQGNDIESHTYSHLNLNTQSLSTIAFQLSQSQIDLASHGINAKLFIYPDGGGAGNATVENLVSNYYFAARSIYPGVLDMAKPFDRYDLPSYTMENTTTLPKFESIVNQAGNSSVVIVYFHKIDYENVDTATTPQTFTAEMQYLHDNNFTVETMKQLFTATS